MWSSRFLQYFSIILMLFKKFFVQMDNSYAAHFFLK